MTETDQPMVTTKPAGLSKSLMLGLVLGLVVGGGAAAGYFIFAAPSSENSALNSAHVLKKKTLQTSYVKLERLTVPLVGEDQLLGYLMMDLALEVPKDFEITVFQQLPALRAALLQEASSEPIGRVDQPFNVDFELLSERLKVAANRELGQDLVQRVLISQTLRV